MLGLCLLDTTNAFVFCKIGWPIIISYLFYKWWSRLKLWSSNVISPISVWGWILFLAENHWLIAFTSWSSTIFNCLFSDRIWYFLAQRSLYRGPLRIQWSHVGSKLLLLVDPRCIARISMKMVRIDRKLHASRKFTYRTSSELHLCSSLQHGMRCHLASSF